MIVLACIAAFWLICLVFALSLVIAAGRADRAIEKHSHDRS